MTDCIGAVAQLFAFDAYGNALGFDPKEALTEFLYSGEQFDAKIGQQYLRARYYDPATGRFNRLDPFFGNHLDPQSLHNYLYCHADPIKHADPSGKFVASGIAVFMTVLSVGVFVGIPLAGIAIHTFAPAPPVAPEYLGPDEKQALEMCGINPTTRTALLSLLDTVRATPYPYFSNNRCNDWMESFLKNYPEYNGTDVTKISLANGAIVMEPLIVPARPEALNYSTLNNGVNDIVLTYHAWWGWNGRYIGIRGFSNHAIVRVTFPQSGQVPNIMYFDIGISDMGAFGGSDFWWDQYDNEFLLQLDINQSMPWSRDQLQTVNQ